MTDISPGYLLIRYPVQARRSTGDIIHGLPVEQMFAGPGASRDVRAAAMAALEREEIMRVYAVCTVFEVVPKAGAPIIRRIEDRYTNAVDFVVKEQMAGRGLQTTQRTPAAYKLNGLAAVEAVAELAAGVTDGATAHAERWNEIASATVASQDLVAATQHLAPAPPDIPASKHESVQALEPDPIKQTSWLDDELAKADTLPAWRQK